MDKLAVIEHEGTRVLTTQQLAQAYETETDRIQQNFIRNQERFIEGRDYYRLEGAELKAFKMSLSFSEEPSIKFAPSLILWTNRGANRHCKILDTDKAWQQFDVLEETYFRAKEMFTVPKSLPEALRMAAELAEQMERQKPLVTFAETCAKSTDSVLVRELAKIASKQGFVIGEKRLWMLLRQWGMVSHRSTEPYQEYVDQGLFEVSQSTKEISGNVRVFRTTRITAKGQIRILNKLKGA